ncbi:MAG: hypothetical protein AAGJ10_11195 [Bacteroidota bacterium]
MEMQPYNAGLRLRRVFERLRLQRAKTLQQAWMGVFGFEDIANYAENAELYELLGAIYRQLIKAEEAVLLVDGVLREDVDALFKGLYRLVAPKHINDTWASSMNTLLGGDRRLLLALMPALVADREQEVAVDDLEYLEGLLGEILAARESGALSTAAVNLLSLVASVLASALRLYPIEGADAFRKGYANMGVQLRLNTGALEEINQESPTTFEAVGKVYRHLKDLASFGSSVTRLADGFTKLLEEGGGG